MDIRLTNNLDFNLDDRNDMPLVEGQNQVEQAIGLAVHDTLYNEIGSLQKDNAVSQIEKQAKRAAKRTEYADEVLGISGRISEDDPQTIIMKIQYGSGELTELSFSE